ncbi:MAG: hypothetical protein EP298_02310 [Gammaproteobacteria bacterium]|nr:MAG: hypothetical protein EP298_02310 [Gammaproteobacteria bacterium]UTW43479.1 hypothetical protein KFE69_05130 [bacterium SCSIO 12844]
MIKISGRHKSIPREIKRSLSKVLPSNTKIVMNDICSCRHTFTVGALKIVNNQNNSLTLRGYYGSGVVNLFVKFTTTDNKQLAIDKINSNWSDI